MEVAVMNRKKSAGLAAIITALLASSALAQSAGNTAPQVQAPPAPQSAPSGTMMGPGMMGQGMPMWGQGMMGPGMMRGGGADGFGMMTRHVEGRIAFLKTELKITGAQEVQWNAVADAMRANAQAMTAMWRGMTETGAAASLSDRLAAHEKLMSARLEALRKYKAAVDPLYAALTDAQKKTADELVPGMMGMGMGRGGGMMGGGMMGRMGAL
jgi:LTXXQ motif family protein